MNAVHKGLKPFKCTWNGCGDSFKSKDVLKDHLSRHENKRQFVCDWPECNIGFNTHNDLYQHRAVHSEERPFKCQRCEKSYKLRSGLIDHHAVTHKKQVRKWKCPFCVLRFARQYRPDIRAVHEDRPLICDLCGRAFNTGTIW